MLRVLRTVRPKYACRSCTDGVVQAKVQPRLIERGMASTALVTHVVVSKFACYLPLYRQVQILAGQGIQLDRATLAGWVKRAAWWLKSVYELQPRMIQAAPRVLRRDADAGARSRTTSHPHLPVLGACHG
ncbi:transposase [Bradyrhizobium sp. S3.12.5]